MRVNTEANSKQTRQHRSKKAWYNWRHHTPNGP